jgi:CelD/BcsL family acetyltransferase involved in cellulose biosynthesis
MNPIQALQLDAHESLAPASQMQRAIAAVTAEFVPFERLAELRADWLDLLARADVPNIFMDLALVQAAANDPNNPTRTLLAWTDREGSRRLVGAWTFAIGRPRTSALPIQVLNAPSFNNSYLAAPVIDRDCLEETLEAMLDALASDPNLPHIVALDSMATETQTMQALTGVLGRRGSPPCVFELFSRPKLASDQAGKAYLETAMSSSSRKKLRQYRRRLGEKGALAFEIASKPDTVRRAFEQFLTMEAAGWKGQRGTAFLSNERDADFARSAIGALADEGRAAIHALMLDGRPVSMQIVLHAGEAAYTWKTAYDENFQDFSPGMLLLEDYTTALLADDRVAYVDSCSHDDTGFMSVWTERQPIADLWFDTRRGGSAAFRFLSRIQSRYRDLRAHAKRAYQQHQKRGAAGRS